MYYEWSHNSHRQKGWPWCARTGLSLDVARLPTCDACGRKVQSVDLWAGSFTCELEGGTKWSDVIGCGSSGPRVLVSDRVKKAIEKLTNMISFTAIQITKVDSKKLSAADAPAYFVMAYQHRYPVLREQSGLAPASCPVCQTAERPPFNERPRQLMTAQPIKEAVFAFSNHRPGVGFCTDELLQLAHDQQWTNFRFEPFDVDRGVSATWAGIDYRSDDWREHLYPAA